MPCKTKILGLRLLDFFVFFSLCPSTGRFVPCKAEWFFEDFPVCFCPTHEDSHFDDTSEHADEDEGAESGEGMTHTTGIAGIGKFVKDFRQNGECADVTLSVHFSSVKIWEQNR